jgi:hypothetical protein
LNRSEDNRINFFIKLINQGTFKPHNTFMNLIYKIFVILSIKSLLILITSIDYKTRLALLIFVFILTGLIYKI